MLGKDFYQQICVPYFSERREKKRFIANLIDRINAVLFEGDAHNHRVTLFREVGLIRAWAHCFWTIVVHLKRPKSWHKLFYYFELPRLTGCLIVYYRKADLYPKSTVKFWVEEDEKDCEGIVGYVRCNRNRVVEIINLPNIDNINLRKLDWDNKKNAETKLVRQYMKSGYIRSPGKLKQMHRKSRHFLGMAVLNKEGKVWGVLLADSIKEAVPFDEEKKAMFETFALILQDAV